MCSRIRPSSDHVFDAFFQIQLPTDASSPPPPPPAAPPPRPPPSTGSQEATIVYKYPANFVDEEILKSVPQFSCPTPHTASTVLHFSFVLTSLDSKWTFGYCRYPPPPANCCLVILSSLPWHDTFYKLLNHIYSLSSRDDKLFLSKFLDALYTVPVPQPGLQLTVEYYVNTKEYQFTAQCPDHHKVPSIPEDRNLTEFFNAIDSQNMITIFASMLNERRILITSKKLSRLSACVQAANSLIYPMHWQHIFIPVLPTTLLDYLSAPMPFLIGVPASTMSRVKKSELGDVVILDSDDNRIETPFQDVQMLPTEIVSYLKKNLKNSNIMLGDGLARTFLKALVILIGGYRDALRLMPGQKITFNEDSFVSSRPPSIQPFLERMLHLQIFQQFIEGRLTMLNDGEGFSDEFEFEVNLYEDRNSHRLRTQYREWLGAMKKEGGAFIKSVNPAMKIAYKQVRDKGKFVKDKGKQAYKDIRSKIQDIQKPAHSNDSLPRSEPSSPIHSPVVTREKRFGDAKADGIKKSVSGVLVTQTEKTMTYLRNKSKSEHKSLYVNGINQQFNNGPLLRPPAGQGKFAPEASPEDSDLDSNNGDDFKYDPINMDLMTDLEDLIFKRNSVGSYISSNSFPNTPLSSESKSSNVQLLPPPTGQAKNGGTVEKSDLIELDSSPDDIGVLFDPLLEPQKCVSRDSSKSQPKPNVLPKPYRSAQLNGNMFHLKCPSANTHLSNRGALLTSSKSKPSSNPFLANSNIVTSSDLKPQVEEFQNVYESFKSNWQKFE